MIDLAAALRAVVTVLEDTTTPYVVGGSVAAASWGVARTTRDVDIVVVAAEAAVDALVDRLDSAVYYVPVEHARHAARNGGTFNVLHLPSGGKVDIFVMPTSDEFTQSRLARRVRADVFGVRTWVDTPEDVVLAKLSWRLASRSEVQWRDCVEVAAVNDLDRPYLAAWAPRLGVEADLAELLAEAAPS